MRHVQLDICGETNRQHQHVLVLLDGLHGGLDGELSQGVRLQSKLFGCFLQPVL